LRSEDILTSNIVTNPMYSSRALFSLVFLLFSFFNV